MKMNMKLMSTLRRLENKAVSAPELNRYFRTKSLDDLLLTLRRCKRDGYFVFETILSAEYEEWQHSRREVLLRTDGLKPVDPFGLLQRDTYGLGVEVNSPLSETQIIEVISKLPPEMAERYLRFKLHSIDESKLYELIASRVKAKSIDEDEFYDRVEYNGLVADGSEITYNGERIKMGFQHRQVVRVFIDKEGKACTLEDFTDHVAGVFTRGSYPNIHHTLRNLIYEVRNELKAVIGKDPISNSNSDGWYLDI